MVLVQTGAIKSLKRGRAASEALGCWVSAAVVAAVVASSTALLGAQRRQSTPQNSPRTSEEPATLVRSLDRGSARALQVTWSSDGSLVAAAGDQMQAFVWDASTGKQLARVHRASAGKYQWQTGFSAVALSSDNKLLATGGQDGQIDLWTLPDGTRTKTLSGHLDSVHGLAFDRTGKFLVSGAGGSFDYSARLWDTGTGSEVWISKQTGIVSSVMFAPDGSVIALTAWEQAILLRASDGKPVGAYVAGNQNEAAQVFTFSSDGAWCLTAGDDGILRGWRRRPAGAKFQLREGRKVISAAFTRAAAGVVSVSDDGGISVWRIPTSRLERRFRLPKGTSVASVSPNAEAVVAAINNEVGIWAVTNAASTAREEAAPR